MDRFGEILKQCGSAVTEANVRSEVLGRVDELRIPHKLVETRSTYQLFDVPGFECMEFWWQTSAPNQGNLRLDSIAGFNSEDGNDENSRYVSVQDDAKVSSKMGYEHENAWMLNSFLKALGPVSIRLRCEKPVLLESKPGWIQSYTACYVPEGPHASGWRNPSICLFRREERGPLYQSIVRHALPLMYYVEKKVRAT